MRTAIVTLSSVDYFIGASRLIKSIKIRTHSADVKYILFTNDAKAREYFGDLFHEIVLLTPLPVNIKASSTIPRFQFTLNKLYALAFLENSSFDRIIFVDSDILCLYSIDFLLKPELNAYQFLAVRDHACAKYYPLEISRLGLNSLNIFNTGCFVINRSILNVINYNDLISKVSKVTKSYDGGDQGYLNFLIQNSNIIFGELPLRYNYPLDINYPIIWQPPSLVHFAGVKPWNFESAVAPWDKSIFQYYNLESFNSRGGGLIKIWYLRNIHIILYRSYLKVAIAYKFITSLIRPFLRSWL